MSTTNTKTVEAVMDALVGITACDDLGRTLTGMELRSAAEVLIRELSDAGFDISPTAP
ncbi:MAG: hypothetical protein ABR616_15705 [Dermatophilaceae bacterium]|nr:hypothetical protein [Intrasporangiaceae bacterium]